MINTRISLDFLKRLQQMPSWSEIAYAFDNQLIPATTVIDYAKDRVAVDIDPNDDELSIASSSLNDSIADAVHRRAKDDRAVVEGDIQLRWANILLAWAYENRAGIPALLDVVEEIYTDFGYPEELAPFVRYMPTDAPDLGSREANEERMALSIGEYVQHFLAPS